MKVILSTCLPERFIYINPVKTTLKEWLNEHAEPIETPKRGKTDWCRVYEKEGKTIVCEIDDGWFKVAVICTSPFLLYSLLDNQDRRPKKFYVVCASNLLLDTGFNNLPVNSRT